MLLFTVFVGWYLVCMVEGEAEDKMILRGEGDNTEDDIKWGQLGTHTKAV